MGFWIGFQCFWIQLCGGLDTLSVFLDLGLWCFGNVASVFRFGSVVFWICCQCFWVCLIRPQWF